MRDAVRKLADPLAYLLIGYVVVEYLISLFHIIIGQKTNYSFAGGVDHYTAYPIATRLGDEASSYLSLTMLIALVVAVAAVTVFGVTRHARLITLGALGTLGFGALLGVICALGGLFQAANPYYGTRDKVENFIGSLILLGVFVLVGLILLQLTRTAALAVAPTAQPGQGFGGYGQQQGWPQQGQHPQGQHPQGQHPQGQHPQGGWPQQGQQPDQQPQQQRQQPQGWPQQQPAAPPQPGQQGWPQQGQPGQPGQPGQHPPGQQGGWPQQ